MPQASKIDENLPREPAPPAGRLTYEEFLEWAPEGLRAEWVDGEVVLMSPVSWRHQELVVFLLALLQHFVQARNLGMVSAGPFQMKGRGGLPGREPDVLYLSNETLKRVKRVYLDGPADLAIEVISPDSRTRDRGEKYYEYEQGGVREYWIIDPDRKQAEFHSLGADGVYRPIPVDADGVLRSVVLAGLWIKMDWLWQEPLPKLMDVLRAWGLV